MKKIFLGHHFFGAGNIGDDLMLAGFLRAVQGHLHQLSLSCCLPHPLPSQQRRFPEIQWLPYEKTIRMEALAESDLWLGLGGSPFQSDDSEWFTEHLREEQEHCHQLGIPMYFLGVGVNNAEVLSRPEILKILSQAEGIWARDQRSFRLLRDYSGTPEKIFLGSDFAHCELVNWRVEHVEANSLGVCFNFQSDLNTHLPPLRSLFDKSKNFHLRWYVQEVRELPQAERSMFAKLLPDEQDALTKILPDYDAPDMETLGSQFPPCEYFLSSRYHAAILQSWYGARVGIWAINDKLQGIAEELQLPSFRRLDEVNPDRRDCFASVPRDLLESLAMRAYGSVIDFFSTIKLGVRESARQAVRDFSIEPGQKVLCVCPDSLGDLVLREPLIHQLCERGLEVTLASRAAGQFLREIIHPKLRGLLIEFSPYSMQERELLSARESIERFLAEVERHEFSVFLFLAYNQTLVEECLRNAFPAIPSVEFSPAGIPAISWGGVLSDAPSDVSSSVASLVSVAKQDHESTKLQCFFSQGLGISEKLRNPQLQLSEELMRRTSSVLESLELSARRYSICCPLGTVNVDIKAIPDELTLAGLAQIRNSVNLPVLLVGIESERVGLERLHALCQVKNIASRVWIGKENQIDLLLGLLKCSYLFFGGDTGPMHMASALGVPTFSIFGGGTYPRFLPQSEGSRFFLEKQDCFGCDWSCIFPSPFCLSKISGHRLQAELRGFLERIPIS